MAMARRTRRLPDGGAPDDAPDDPNSRPGRIRRLSRPAQALLLVGCLLAVAIAGVVGTLGFVQHRIGSQLELLDDPFESLTDRPEAVEPVEDAAGTSSAPVNILVIGSDSRISAGDPTQWSYGAQRTDAIMLVHIAGDRQSMEVMSIPRDSWVPVPGHGEAKINAAYSWGGPALLIETVEELTDVRVDHVAITDFESFAALTDELGGVEITLPDGMDSRGVVLSPGTHTLTGEQALAYVRERYGLPGGDFDRVQRQQNWMREILRTTFRSGVLTNPVALTSFLGTAASATAVDEGFTISEMRDLALSMHEMRPGDVTFLTVPVTGTGWSADGQSIVELDRAAFDDLMAATVADDLSDYVEDHPDLMTLGSAGSVH